MNNAVYGKTMEHLKNRVSLKLVNNEKDHLKFTSKTSYMPHKTFDMIQLRQDKAKFQLKRNKPSDIGICIQELSKVLMYEFHYDHIKNEYDNKSKLLFGDTDGLLYEIKTEDVYVDFSSNKEMFDFINYSTKSKYYDDSNKLVVGKIKDKTGGVAIKEFVGLKPKMYSFLVDDNSEHKKEKGVNKNVDAAISHNEHKE